jgi:hypothetical protein
MGTPAGTAALLLGSPHPASATLRHKPAAGAGMTASAAQAPAYVVMVLLSSVRTASSSCMQLIVNQQQLVASRVVWYRSVVSAG